MGTLSIWVIRFEDEHGRELTGLRGSVRVASESQDLAEAKADDILNAWLQANPGSTGSWSVGCFQEPQYRREARVNATLAGYAAKLRGDH